MKMAEGLPTEKLVEAFTSTKGFLIGRLHGLEPDTLLEYVAGNGVGGITPKTREHLCQTPGFYAPEHEFDKVLGAWCDIYLESLRACDILATLGFEQYNSLVENHYDEIFIWSCAQLHQWLPFLEGKRVLVISPFASTICRQWMTKDFAKMFVQYGKNQGLPAFTYPKFTLLALKSPNTVLGNEPFPHNNWLESFEYLKQEIHVGAVDFDIAITGCGSYGMPIAHYVKTLGHGAIQAGSYTQVMFGIKGQRWKDQGWWNEHWVYPSQEETPPSFRMIENGDYWSPE